MVKNLVGMIDPVAHLTNVWQGSKVSTADTAEKWLKLLAVEPLHKYVKER